jgi:hypothetical protein
MLFLSEISPLQLARGSRHGRIPPIGNTPRRLFTSGFTGGASTGTRIAPSPSSNEIVDTGSVSIAGRQLPVAFHSVLRSLGSVMSLLLSNSISDTPAGRPPAGSVASISLIKLVNLDKRPLPYSTG